MSETTVVSADLAGLEMRCEAARETIKRMFDRNIAKLSPQARKIAENIVSNHAMVDMLRMEEGITSR